MRNYPAKILLFGEYTIISGGMALAIPYHKFNGHWQYAKVSEDRHKLQQELSDFTTYLESLHYEGQLLCELDIDAIWDELERGLFFQSDIPIGYGAGSSGAFCAAFYDRFVRHKLDGQQMAPLKAQLAQLESFFHGSSSGLDPLVCYLDKTLLFEEGQLHIQEKTNSLEEAGLFLLDSGRSRQTAPLVELFLERKEDDHYARRLQAELLPLNEEAIQAYLQSDYDLLFDRFHQISHFQWKYFADMIPREWKDAWLEGLSGDRFKLKLCGAGGGGFILGMGEAPIGKEGNS